MADETVLGRTGLRVGRLGVAASYGVPASAVEQAFEQGANYLYWGSMRRKQFGEAVRNLARQRDHLVLVVQSYSRMASLVGWSLERALRELRFDYADVLLLGMWNRAVPARMLDAAHRLKERGLVRFLGVSTHNRKLAPALAVGRDFDIIHFRYNAAHPGAERDIFPLLPEENRPGLVAYTATSWRQLLRRGATAGDCYRFVLSQPAVNVCMSGPADAAQMRHALDAWQQGPMSPDELQRMRRLTPQRAG